MKAYFQQLFKYNAWANKKLIESVEEQAIENEVILKLITHLLLAEKIWLLRISGGEYEGINPWNMMSIADCELLTDKNSKNYSAFIESTSEYDFQKLITYKNIKGATYTSSLTDILTHISLHSHYHRGQIAKEVRSINKEPSLTDYIAYIREDN